MKSLLLLPNDSIYWKLTKNQRNKYLPGAMPALEDGFSIIDLDQTMAEYYDYYCDIHSEKWFNDQILRDNAVDAAKDQISASNGVLTDPQYAMSMDDRQRLSEKIDELSSLISSDSSTVGAIEQKTEELRQLTEMLVALYTPVEPEI